MNSISNFFANPSSPFGSFLSNIGSWIGKFQQFAKDPVREIMSMKNVNIPKDFHGTPEELGKYLMSTGQLSKEDFEKFAQSANQLQNILPKF